MMKKQKENRTMKHILIYYKLDPFKKMIIAPVVYECKSNSDAIAKQNHLRDLGFQCEYYIIQ